MIMLGLLLILVAAGAAVIIGMAPTATSQVIDLSLLDVNASPLAIFIAGASSVILLGLGISLIGRGTRRRASSRKELRELRKGQAAEAGHRPAEEGQPGRVDRPEDDSTVATTKTTSTGSGTGRGTGGGTGSGTDASTRKGGDSGSESSS